MAAADAQASKPDAADPAAVAANWATWTTDEGYPFFHNEVTNETVWEEPEALRKAKEVEAAKAALEEENEWAEAAKRDEERKARKAARLKAEAERAAAQAATEVAQEAEAAGEAQPGTAAASLLADVTREVSRVETIRACAALQQLIAEVGAKSHSTWESVLPKLAVDARFSAVPSLALRRRIFDWWCKQRAADPEAAAEEAARTAQAAQSAATSRWAAELSAAARDGRLAVVGLTFDAFRAGSSTQEGRDAAAVIGAPAAREAFAVARAEAFAAAEASRASERRTLDAHAAERRGRARKQASAAFEACVSELPWVGADGPAWEDARTRREDGTRALSGAAGGGAGPSEAMGAGLRRGGPGGGRGAGAASAVLSRPALGRDPRWAGSLSDEDMETAYERVLARLRAGEEQARRAAEGEGRQRGGRKRPREGEEAEEGEAEEGEYGGRGEPGWSACDDDYRSRRRGRPRDERGSDSDDGARRPSEGAGVPSPERRRRPGRGEDLFRDR